MKKIAVVFFIALALAGCTVGPNYVRPPAPASETFKEMDGWTKAAPADQMLRGKWWEVFNDPALNKLEEQVGISNQNVLAAEAQFRQAEALVRVARSAYFPTATIGPSVSRSFQITPGGPSVPVTLTTLPVNASWEVDLWGRVRRQVEASSASAQASAADIESVRLSSQAQLAQDYFQLRSLDAQSVLLDQTVEAYRKTLELTQNRYDSGVAARGDVLQADTQLKTTQAQAIDVGVQRAQYEHAIALLVGKVPSDLSLPSMALDTLPPAIPVGVPSVLLERRPDIAAAERSMASANAQIGVAIAAYYPSLTLSGEAGFQSLDLLKLLTWPARIWGLGAGLSETVFEGGLRKAQTDQARAAYDAAVASYRQTVLTGFQEVEDNLAALRILEHEADVQTQAVELADQSLAVMINQYRAGTVAYLNVITAQTTVLSNKITALNILGRRMSAAVLLIEALGGGWDVKELPAM
jgi:NodT family efflux transporter outer membrane factor (OMF) lipoprotein